jgi:hypothetical protein
VRRECHSSDITSTLFLGLRSLTWACKSTRAMRLNARLALRLARPREIAAVTQELSSLGTSVANLCFDHAVVATSAASVDDPAAVAAVSVPSLGPPDVRLRSMVLEDVMFEGAPLELLLSPRQKRRSAVRAPCCRLLLPPWNSDGHLSRIMAHVGVLSMVTMAQNSSNDIVVAVRDATTSEEAGWSSTSAKTEDGQSVVLARLRSLARFSSSFVATAVSREQLAPPLDLWLLLGDAAAEEASLEVASQKQQKDARS